MLTLICVVAILGGALSFFGENVSTSYETGMKIAISDYYNDQIRELYEKKPQETELKEVCSVWLSWLYETEA